MKRKIAKAVYIVGVTLLSSMFAVSVIGFIVIIFIHAPRITLEGAGKTLLTVCGLVGFAGLMTWAELNKDK